MLLHTSHRKLDLTPPGGTYYTLDETISGVDPYAAQTLSFAKGDTNTAGGSATTVLAAQSVNGALEPKGNTRGTVTPKSGSISTSVFTFEMEMSLSAKSLNPSETFSPGNQYLFDTATNGGVLRWQGGLFGYIGFSFAASGAGQPELRVTYNPDIGHSFHFALVFDGQFASIYIDGIFQNKSSYVKPIAFSTLSLFNYGGGNTYGLNGRVKNLRVTAAARYNENFLYRR